MNAQPRGVCLRMHRNRREQRHLVLQDLMSPIIYIHSRSGPPEAHPTPKGIVVVLDVGEDRSIALITVPIPPGQGEEPQKQFLHSALLKLIHDVSRREEFLAGRIALQNGATDEDLKAEIVKSSEIDDSLSETSRELPEAPR